MEIAHIVFLMLWYILSWFFKFFVLHKGENCLVGVLGGIGKGDVNVDAHFFYALTECIDDVLEFILGFFPTVG